MCLKATISQFPNPLTLTPRPILSYFFAGHRVLTPCNVIPPMQTGLFTVRFKIALHADQVQTRLNRSRPV